MDKLAKRAGVAMLVVIVAAGSAFALGMARFASSVQSDTAATAPRLAPALRIPIPPPAPVVDTGAQPLQVPEVVVLGKPTKAPGVAAQAASRPVEAVAIRAAESEPMPPSEPADDMLDLDFGAHQRGAKLADRSPNAFGARQLGGAEEKHRRLIPGERVTFETDLARPEH